MANPIKSSITVNSSVYPLDVCSLVASKYLAASSVLNESKFYKPDGDHRDQPPEEHQPLADVPVVHVLQHARPLL